MWSESFNSLKVGKVLQGLLPLPTSKVSTRNFILNVSNGNIKVYDRSSTLIVLLFYVQPSIQNARCTVQPVKSIDTDENVSFAMMETDTICIDGDENKSIEGTVNLNTVEQKDIPDDQDTGKDIINSW